MKQLLKFFSQILLLLIFISSIKTTQAVNCKLTSVINDFNGNLSLWDGKRQASIDIYVDWCVNSFGWFLNDLNMAWNRSIVPLITWMIANCNHGDSGDPGIMKFVRNGTYDSYINQFSDIVKKWLAGPDGIYGNDDDRRAYIRLGMTFDGIAYSERKTDSFLISHEKLAFTFLLSMHRSRTTVWHSVSNSPCLDSISRTLQS
jgi:hypothetical protein